MVTVTLGAEYPVIAENICMEDLPGRSARAVKECRQADSESVSEFGAVSTLFLSSDSHAPGRSARAAGDRTHAAWWQQH